MLIRAISLREATQSVSLDQAQGNGSLGRGLDVLVAGSTLPPNPGELIESHAMEAVLQQAKATYDLVVLDTPPLTAVSDAFPLLRKVDGVIIVGRVGRNRRDVAERMHETLTGAGAPLLGVIANGFKASGRGSYAYSYAYSYARDEKAAAAAVSSSASPGAAAADSPNGSETPLRTGAPNE